MTFARGAAKSLRTEVLDIKYEEKGEEKKGTEKKAPKPYAVRLHAEGGGWLPALSTIQMGADRTWLFVAAVGLARSAA
jgi:hypothetical protein